MSSRLGNLSLLPFNDFGYIFVYAVMKSFDSSKTVQISSNYIVQSSFKLKQHASLIPCSKMLSKCFLDYHDKDQDCG